METAQECQNRTTRALSCTEHAQPYPGWQRKPQSPVKNGFNPLGAVASSGSYPTPRAVRAILG